MTGEVVEVCGGWGKGKTSLCLQLALHAALRQGLHTLFIDPSGSVSPSKLAPFIEAFSEEEEVSLRFAFFLRGGDLIFFTAVYSGDVALDLFRS